jgi:hypothetical protein
MQKRITIYVGDELEKVIAERKAEKESQSVSGVIGVVADRYRLMINDNIPGLSEKEWAYVFQTLNGFTHFLETGKDAIQYAVFNLIDGLEEAESFEVNAKAFRAKLEKLTLSQKIAMVDVAAQFWSKPKRSVPEFLEEIGRRRTTTSRA